MDGWDWKSLKASIPRAPLCGANDKKVLERQKKKKKKNACPQNCLALP